MFLKTMENFHIPTGGGGIKPHNSFSIADLLDPLHIVDRTFNFANHSVDTAGNTVRDLGHEAGQTVRELGKDAKDAGESLFQTPLIIGAIGLVLVIALK